MVYPELVKSEDGTAEQMGHRSPQYTSENDRRQMDGGQTRNSSGPDRNRAIAIYGARIQRETETSKTPTNSEPLLDALVATQSKTTEGASPLRSLQSTNWRMPQNNSTRSRKIGSKK